jgi:CubicO group peptidase (beta-lactamase class C family)
MRLKIAGTIAFLILIIRIQFVYASNYEESKIDNIIAEFEGQLVSILKRDRTDASISFALINKSNIVYVNAIGHAKIVKPADSMSIYRIGSITKTFTAFLMMQLVEDGTIHLDEAVEIYLAEIKHIRGYDINRKITFRQLASHTSGMIREPRNFKSSTGGIELWENKTLISISKTSLKNQSGEKFLYSNIGYALLGLALSRAANKPFMELIEEKIFIPLGMTNTYFKIPTNKSNQLALGMGALFKNKINKRAAKEHYGRGYKVPSGGIYSTSFCGLAKVAIDPPNSQTPLKLRN